VTVTPPGQPSGVALPRPQDAGMEGRAPGGHTGISFISPDVKKSYEERSAKGVQFTSPPQQMPWGAWATWFTDPDGNSFFLTEPQK
jgi:predicted enzyme related to lactoylglutathione lyase